MKVFIYISLIFISIQSLIAQDYVYVEDGQLKYKEDAYQYIGTNLWQAVPWAMNDLGKLKAELDVLDSLGIRNLRILANAQGPATAPWRITESLQSSPNQMDSSWLEALDLVLDELAKREMKAILYLGNFWHWSGGFAQYINWATGDPIPYPPPAEEGDWQAFEDYAARFYKNKKAKSYYYDAMELIVERRNRINGRLYKSDPTIMAWQLCNEPRAAQNPRAFRRWLRRSARKIKKLGIQQLLSSGSEGLATNWQKPKAQKQWKKVHQNEHIDYLTLHLWPQNWDWYDPATADSLPQAQIQAYLDAHLAIGQELKKPLVLEEFGLARDGGAYTIVSTDIRRRAFYELIFKKLLEEQRLAGCNFWAWSGSNYPARAGEIWQKGDPYCGDPPHELQGWYSVYLNDREMLDLIKAYQLKLNRQK
jgi:mannan endo-1,4-beta-mannosidase